MKYIITKTDISINGIIHSEGSVIDSSKYNQKVIDSVSHLLIPSDNPSKPINLDIVDDQKTAKNKTEKPVSKKNKRSTN